MAADIAPEVWTLQSFYFDIAAVNDWEDGGGVPQDRVPGIAAAVLATLVEHGLEPETVYLSGHDGLEPDPDAAKLRAARAAIPGYDDSIDPADDYEDFNTADYSEQADRDYRADIGALEGRIQEEVDAVYDGPEKPIYHMSHTGTLGDVVGQYTNPIHFAGISPTSTIVVYDRELINRWDLDMPTGQTPYNPSVMATEAELAVAVLARIRLRYEIEGMQNESPPLAPTD